MDIAEQYAECMNQCIQDAATAEKRLEAANAQIEQLKQRLAAAYKACRKLLADHKELFCLVKMVVFHDSTIVSQSAKDQGVTDWPIL